MNRIPTAIWVAIIGIPVAIIAAIGTYFAAIQPKLIEIRFTQTAEARHTAYVLTEEAEATSILLSETPTLTPSATATPTLTNTPTPLPPCDDPPEWLVASFELDPIDGTAWFQDLDNECNWLEPPPQEISVQWEDLGTSYSIWVLVFDNVRFYSHPCAAATIPTTGECSRNINEGKNTKRELLIIVTELSNLPEQFNSDAYEVYVEKGEIIPVHHISVVVKRND